MDQKHSQRQAWQTIGLAPAVVFAVLLIWLYADGSTVLYESPAWLAILNTLFLGLIPLAGAYYAARSFSATRLSGYLFTGCGLAAFGLSSLMAGWVMPLAGGPNPTVTLHNSGSLLAGACLLAGCIFLQ